MRRFRAAHCVQCQHAVRAQGNPNAATARADPASGRDLRRSQLSQGSGREAEAGQREADDGQTVSGWIEYYDKHMVRLTREGAPNLFIFKHEIMYIADDGGGKK